MILHHHPLLTSARKAHLYTIRELLRFWARTVLSGGRTFRNREGFLVRWAAMKTAIGVPTAAEFAPAFEYVARVRQVADPLGELSVQRSISGPTVAADGGAGAISLRARQVEREGSARSSVRRGARLCLSAPADRARRHPPLPGFEETDYARAAGAHGGRSVICWVNGRSSVIRRRRSRQDLPETDWLNTGTSNDAPTTARALLSSSSATPNIIWLCWRIDTESVEVFCEQQVLQTNHHHVRRGRRHRCRLAELPDRAGPGIGAQAAPAARRSRAAAVAVALVADAAVAAAARGEALGAACDSCGNDRREQGRELAGAAHTVGPPGHSRHVVERRHARHPAGAERCPG